MKNQGRIPILKMKPETATKKLLEQIAFEKELLKKLRKCRANQKKYYNASTWVKQNQPN